MGQKCDVIIFNSNADWSTSDLYTRSWLVTGGSDALFYSGWGSGLADNNGRDYGIERKF